MLLVLVLLLLAIVLLLLSLVSRVASPATRPRVLVPDASCRRGRRRPLLGRQGLLQLLPGVGALDGRPDGLRVGEALGGAGVDPGPDWRRLSVRVRQYTRLEIAAG